MKNLMNFLLCILVTSAIPVNSYSQINKLSSKVISKAQSINSDEKEETHEDRNADKGSESNIASPMESQNNTEPYQAEIADETQEDKVELPDYFSEPERHYDDKSITKEKIVELFKKYDRNCDEVQKIWIGELDRPEEWHTFKTSAGIPDFMRTNRYFSVVFKSKDGNCYYTWNNLALRKDYAGGGKYEEMKVTSVKYRTVQIDCADVK